MPVMAVARTHYDTLGIEPDADEAAVRRAWKTLIQVWHPDRFSGDMREEAERMTSRINEAWNTLRSSASRDAYDRKLAAERSAECSPAAAAGASRSAFTARRGNRYSTPAGRVVRHETSTPGETLSQGATELVSAIRRYPRLALAGAAMWALILGATMITNAATPTAPARQLPAAAPSAPAALQLPDIDDDVAGTHEQPVAPAGELPNDGQEHGVSPDDPALYATPDTYAEPGPQLPPGARVVTIRPKRQS